MSHRCAHLAENNIVAFLHIFFFRSVRSYILICAAARTFCGWFQSVTSFKFSFARHSFLPPWHISHGLFFVCVVPCVGLPTHSHISIDVDCVLWSVDLCVWQPNATTEIWLTNSARKDVLCLLSEPSSTVFLFCDRVNECVSKKNVNVTYVRSFCPRPFPWLVFFAEIAGFIGDENMRAQTDMIFHICFSMKKPETDVTLVRKKIEQRELWNVSFVIVH